MRLNIYKRTFGKPMIFNLDSAAAFLEQTKEPMEIHGPEMKKDYYIIIKNNSLQIVHRERIGDIGIDTELYCSSGKEAVKDIYKMRKHINQKFSR